MDAAGHLNRIMDDKDLQEADESHYWKSVAAVATWLQRTARGMAAIATSQNGQIHVRSFDYRNIALITRAGDHPARIVSLGETPNEHYQNASTLRIILTSLLHSPATPAIVREALYNSLPELEEKLRDK